MVVKELKTIFEGRFYTLMCDGEYHVERSGFRHFSYKQTGKCNCEKMEASK